MALLKYFKPIKRSTLPLPNGPLSEFVPSSSIEAANKEVASIVSQAEKSLSKNDAEGNGAAASESKVMKRGPYVKFSRGQLQHQTCKWLQRQTNLEGYLAQFYMEALL